MAHCCTDWIQNVTCDGLLNQQKSQSRYESFNWCRHRRPPSGDRRRIGPARRHGPSIQRVNTALSNIKNAITSTHRAVRDKHLPRYLAEFEYRFNRSYEPAAMMLRPEWVAVRTPPMTYNVLKLAEHRA